MRGLTLTGIASSITSTTSTTHLVVTIAEADTPQDIVISDFVCRGGQNGLITNLSSTGLASGNTSFGAAGVWARSPETAASRATER